MAETLRISFVARAPFHSGAEIALCRSVQGLADAGHDVQVICGCEGATSDQLRSGGKVDVEVVPLLSTGWRTVVSFRRCVGQLRRLLRQHAADLVHVNDVPGAQAACLAARREGLPRVVHVRYLLDSPEGARWFLKFGFDRVIAISQFMEQHLIETDAALFADRTTRVYDALDVPDERELESRASARQRLDMPSEPFTFVFAGQFSPVKGIETLIRAIARLPEGVAGACRFYLVGDDLQDNGRYRREMMRLASDICDGREVEFPGFRRDMSRWFAAANCVVVPSRLEPLGLVVMEAMSVARAVIGSNAGGIREMIQPGRTGLLMKVDDPADLATAMESVASDPARTDEMGLAGLQRAHGLFGLEHHVAQLEGLYHECLNTATNR